MKRLLFPFVLIVTAAVWAMASAAPAASSPGAGPVFVFQRVFKSSVPEYIEIRIPAEPGIPSYDIRQLDDTPAVTKFEVSAALRQKIFTLVAELNHFHGVDLDVHRKIANLGEKTFRWEDGGSSAEVKFNYTTNGAAMQLLQICEGLARQQELIELLQRRIKYDRLGVNDALLQFERDYSNGMLPEPQRALPLLEAIANDTKFVEIARQRARALAEKVRRPTGESSSTSAP